jgi:hypothetical protein
MPMRPMYGIWPAILGEKVCKLFTIFKKVILIINLLS